MLDEHWMAEHPKNQCSKVNNGEEGGMEQKGDSRCSLDNHHSERVPNWNGVTWSRWIEVKSCNLWKGMNSDKVNLRGFQRKGV